MDPTHATDPQIAYALAPSVPLVDPSTLPVRTWCLGSREDPVTGLVAFPDFHAYLPAHLIAALREGRPVGLTIGDVDDLKKHVEAVGNDPAHYGHLAGNKVIAAFGGVVRVWFADQNWQRAVAATFGGDEVVIAAAITDPASFIAAIADLRDRLGATLPVRVSFAVVTIGPGQLPTPPPGSRDGGAHDFADQLLAALDKSLFAHKRLRRSRGGPGGILSLAYPHGQPCRRALPRLPADGGDPVHLTARPTTINGQPVLLLPMAGPTGHRGRRARLTIPTTGTTADTAAGTTVTCTVISIDGQAAIPTPSDLPGLLVGDLPVTLAMPRPRSVAALPTDLRQALAAEQLDWGRVPAHEQNQLLHMIRESATPQIRAARIADVLAAVGHRQLPPA
ncbi:hypothetical protein [Actinomadura hibisca]|uniref:hypothetical protein n=1 Tax=Actinomadura hibisca TaxID=68565 RepID=UPI000834B24E|nr:hypothetical protein [Actinomadura hibisca]